MEETEVTRQLFLCSPLLYGPSVAHSTIKGITNRHREFSPQRPSVIPFIETLKILPQEGFDYIYVKIQPLRVLNSQRCRY